MDIGLCIIVFIIGCIIGMFLIKREMFVNSTTKLGIEIDAINNCNTKKDKCICLLTFINTYGSSLNKSQFNTIIDELKKERCGRFYDPLALPIPKPVGLEKLNE